jgi:DNA-binding CsgD family transcriptional regulator
MLPFPDREAAARHRRSCCDRDEPAAILKIEDGSVHCGGEMFLSATQSRTLSKLMVTLAEPHGEAEIRERIGLQLLDLLDADYYASYVWDATRGVFGSRVALNMSDRNLSSYEAYYQYHDPITSQMQRHREATLVEQVMPQSELVKTEFFNDFLHRDGLYWGVNLYAWDGDENIGDMRIWRSRKRERFGRDALELLELIKPAFVAALKRGRQEYNAASPGSGGSAAPIPRLLPADAGSSPRALAAARRASLSERERAVVQLASIGLRDKAIAQRLGIGFTTVRTHLSHAFRKLGVENRTQLVDRVARLE